jgi:hypothetical protein
VCLNATGNTAHTIGWDVQWKKLLLGSLVVFLSDSRQLLEEYIKTDNNQLVPHPSKFIICHHPTIRPCVIETLDISITKPTSSTVWSFCNSKWQLCLYRPSATVTGTKFLKFCPSFPCPPLLLATKLANVFTLIYYFGLLLNEGAILFCYIVSFSCDKDLRMSTFIWATPTTSATTLEWRNLCVFILKFPLVCTEALPYTSK